MQLMHLLSQGLGRSAHRELAAPARAARLRAAHVAEIVPESMEIDLGLFQHGFRQENSNRHGQLDLGFVLLKEGPRDDAAGELVACSRRAVSPFVQAHTVVGPGAYAALALSFNHWGLGLAEAPRGVFALHSAKPVYAEKFAAPPGFLADALAALVHHKGTMHQGSTGVQSWYLTSGWGGMAVMVENHLEDRFLRVDCVCADSENVVSTRGRLRTTDCIPPLHRQIVILLSQLEMTQNYYVSHKLSYRTAFERGLGDWYPADPTCSHQPPLTDHVMALHQPRPLFL